MSPPKDMDIETQERIARIETSFAGLLEKLEPLPELVKTLTVLQERQNSHASSLDMLLKRDAELQVEVEGVKRSCDGSINSMKEKMALLRGIGVGVMAVSTIVSGMAVYVAQRAIDSVQTSLTDVRQQTILINNRLTWLEYQAGKKPSIQ